MKYKILFACACVLGVMAAFTPAAEAGCSAGAGLFRGRLLSGRLFSGRIFHHSRQQAATRTVEVRRTRVQTVSKASIVDEAPTAVSGCPCPAAAPTAGPGPAPAAASLLRPAAPRSSATRTVVIRSNCTSDDCQR
jgi:hypothetical protein